MFTGFSNILVKRPVILQLLRFACIGALNTALDFVILNLLTHAFGIEGGLKLWLINAVGVTAAIVQSYYWNKHWAFAVSASSNLLRQFVGLVLVGGLGFAAFIAAVFPSISTLLVNRGVLSNPVFGSSQYYGIVLLSFILLQIIFGVNIGFQSQPETDSASAQFGKFILVSIIGVVINSTVLAVLFALIIRNSFSVEADLAKNIAKFVAVLVSLAWNFIGYKFIVFRR